MIRGVLTREEEEEEKRSSNWIDEDDVPHEVSANYSLKSLLTGVRHI